MITLRPKKPITLTEPLVERVQVALVADPSTPNSGVGRYTRMLTKGLPDAGVRSARFEPAPPELPGLLGDRTALRELLRRYPLWASYPPAEIYHLTSQNLAGLLLFCRPRGRTIVTVHDMPARPLRTSRRQDGHSNATERMLNRLALAGLRNADRLVTNSWHLKSCLVNQLSIRPDMIDVIYPGIDHQRYRPQLCPPEVRERHGLRDNRRYLITVGADEPRKNLGALLQALALLRRTQPDIELLKIGRPGLAAERKRLTDLATDLGVAGAVHFLDDVPEEDMPLLYSQSSLCVLPSHDEGFGFPALEAMACGTPVVYAASAALPEVVGRSGLTFKAGPDEHKELAAMITDALDERTARLLRSAGMGRSGSYRWPQTINNLIETYQRCEPNFKQEWTV
ncbi:MAG TPA: glycosyltransferase family 1 protein [Roseiflexaceae bacterium]|nr:glycosyltransferase family 1 protein [Roseiflexaceae bacterium]